VPQGGSCPTAATGSVAATTAASTAPAQWRPRDFDAHTPPFPSDEHARNVSTGEGSCRDRRMSVENRPHSRGKPGNRAPAGPRPDVPYGDICHRKRSAPEFSWEPSPPRLSCRYGALSLTNLTVRPTHFANEARSNGERLHSRRGAVGPAENRPQLAEPETGAGALPQRSAQLSPQRLRVGDGALAMVQDLAATVRCQ
jgi:hypothetical protein